MRKLFALFLSFALFLGCMAVSASAEGPAGEDLTGTWYVESMKDSTYPDVVFSGTSLSRTITFNEDGTLDYFSSATGSSMFKWRLEGDTIYTLSWREGESTVLNEGEGIVFATIEDGKLVTTFTASSGEIEDRTYYSREPVKYPIADRKTPVTMEDVEGTWRITGFGLDNTLVSAEDFGFEGTAEIREHKLIMHLTVHGEDRGETVTEFDPEIKYDSLYTATDILSYKIMPLADGKLLYSIGAGTVIWLFEPME